MGNVYFRGSKDFAYKNKTWWYSIDPEVIKRERIAYIVLAADVKGIFLIPSSVFLAYFVDVAVAGEGYKPVGNFLGGVVANGGGAQDPWSCH